MWAAIAQSVWRLATDRTALWSNLCWGEIFRTRPDRPWGPPSLLYNGYRVFPGGKAAGAWCWPPTPECSRKSRAIPLSLRDQLHLTMAQFCEVDEFRCETPSSEPHWTVLSFMKLIIMQFLHSPTTAPHADPNIPTGEGTASRSQWPCGLQPLACWNCGFESFRGHECLLRVLCVVN